MPDNFELGGHADVMDGTLNARMVDNDGIESNVLHVTVDNGIRVRWYTEGMFTPLIDNACLWNIQAAFESIGPTPPEFIVAGVGQPYVPGAHGYVIPLPANTIQAGAYKIVVMVSLLDPTGAETFVNGFVEIPMVRFR
jgi:hypothetical protein